MSRDFEANGEAKIAVNVRWRGIALRFDKDPDEVRIVTVPARIMRKTVATSFERFDRAKGHDVSRLSSRLASKPRRLRAYRLWGDDWTEILS